jgi:hypothetical protein
LDVAIETFMVAIVATPLLAENFGIYGVQGLAADEPQA